MGEIILTEILICFTCLAFPLIYFLVQQKSKQLSKDTNNDRPKIKRNAVISEAQNEQAPEKAYDEEKQSEALQKLESFSEEDLSEFLEKSMMEDADFHELRYQPLQVQLERLFGEEADGYLNPTVKESPRKVFDLGIAKKSKLTFEDNLRLTNVVLPTT